MPWLNGFQLSVSYSCVARNSLQAQLIFLPWHKHYDTQGRALPHTSNFPSLALPYFHCHHNCTLNLRCPTCKQIIIPDGRITMVILFTGPTGTSKDAAHHWPLNLEGECFFWSFERATWFVLKRPGKEKVWKSSFRSSHWAFCTDTLHNILHTWRNYEINFFCCC